MATFGLHLFNNVEWADLDFELLKRDHAGPATARLSYTPCVDLTSRCLGRYARLKSMESVTIFKSKSNGAKIKTVYCGMVAMLKASIYIIAWPLQQ